MPLQNKMADVDLEQLDTEIESENRTEKRIKDLSEKVRLTAEERDEQKRLKAESDTKIADLEKERDFLNSFTEISGKYPDASSYRDKIKEKVLKGYSVEDATVSTLAGEGKFNPPKPVIKVDSPVGGSAINQPTTGGEKPLSEMSREEKRAKLMEAEQRGDISVT